MARSRRDASALVADLTKQRATLDAGDCFGETARFAQMVVCRVCPASGSYPGDSQVHPSNELRALAKIKRKLQGRKDDLDGRLPRLEMKIGPVEAHPRLGTCSSGYHCIMRRH